MKQVATLAAVGSQRARCSNSANTLTFVSELLANKHSLAIYKTRPSWARILPYHITMATIRLDQVCLKPIECHGQNPDQQQYTPSLLLQQPVSSAKTNRIPENMQTTLTCNRPRDLYMRNGYLKYKRENPQHLHVLKNSTHEYSRSCQNFQLTEWSLTTHPPLSRKSIVSLLIQSAKLRF
jgi:hypothetical protein